jgi:hypothetical protein
MCLNFFCKITVYTSFAFSSSFENLFIMKFVSSHTGAKVLTSRASQAHAGPSLERSLT